MNVWCQIILIATISLISGGASGAEMTEQLGWYEDRDTVLAEVSTIAILPTLVRIEAPNADKAVELIEAHIAARLAGLGVEVLPASVFRELLNDTKVTLGGYYDPLTGEVIEDRYKSIMDLTYREFERLHDFQAYFRPEIKARAASFYGNTAAWDGVEEALRGKKGLWIATYSFGNYGKVASASLIGVVFAPDETTYFAHAGGIQLLVHFKNGRFEPVAPELLLIDESKLYNAVELVMRPLLTPILRPEVAKALREQQRKQARDKGGDKSEE